MNELIVKLPRRVIPRWRDFATTAAAGELGGIKPAKEQVIELPAFLGESKEQWAQMKTPLAAGALLTAALFERDWDSASEAASFFLSDEVIAPQFTKDLARSVLDWAPSGEPFPLIAPSSTDATEFSKRSIGVVRRLLSRFPMSAIHWVELALGYAIIGKAEKARRAILAAVQLAPEDRFVLRSAVRFFLHQEDAETAKYILAKSQRIKTDSWLLASHLSVSAILHEDPRFFKQARETFASENISHFNRSELGAALATTELADGNDRRSRKLFKLALVDPTENTLAQALWAKSQIVIEQQQNLLNLPLSFEANARFLVGVEKWREALLAVKSWQNDEPFSARPAILGSYLASSAFDDYAQSVEVAKTGLAANPEDATLLNNIAYAEANAGNIEKARSALAKLHRVAFSANDKIPYLATSGIVEFRAGNTALGRSLYLEAARLATGKGLEQLYMRARIHHAREEVRAATEYVDIAIADIPKNALSNSESTVKLAIRKLNQELKNAGREEIGKPPQEVMATQNTSPT